MRNFSKLSILILALALFLVACGDNTATSVPTTTTAAPTTAVTTTVAARTTTAASGATAVANGLAGVPPYPGATLISVPDTILNQFTASVGTTVKNPQVGAFTTADTGSQVKTYYTDYFGKNGWTDLSTTLGSSGAQFDQMGGFFLLYSKDKTVFVVIGLPGAAAAALGASGMSVPATGSLVMGFVGEAP